MKVENTSRISTNYEQVVLFLLKGNRNSLRNSLAQCISLQSLWSSQSCQASHFCWKLCVLCISLSPASASPASSLLPTPPGEALPDLPCPQCTFWGSSRSLSTLSPLQSSLLLGRWKWITQNSKWATGHVAHTSKGNALLGSPSW